MRNDLVVSFIFYTFAEGQTLSKKEKQVPLREPDLLIVITGGQLAYTREDGVKVIPLACLRD